MACLLVMCFVLQEASAQMKLGSSVMGSGGGACVCATYKATCTVGEPVIGATSGASTNLGGGFWGAIGSKPLTAVGDLPDAPLAFGLEQNYPNPFNPRTVVSCQWPVASRVSLVVYDLLGREVARLLDEWKEAGTYSIEFHGAKLSSGVYVYRLTAGEYVQCRKMILAK